MRTVAKKEQDRDTATGVGSQESVAQEEQLLWVLGVGQAAEGRTEGELRKGGGDSRGEGVPRLQWVWAEGGRGLLCLF